MGCSLLTGNQRIGYDTYDIDDEVDGSSPTHQQERPLNGLVGLKNLGNTCFMNAALQCLLHIDVLVNYFCKINWKMHINRSNPLGFHGEVALSFGELVTTVCKCRGPSSVVIPNGIKKTLGKYFRRFSRYEQEDAQELLAFLLDGLHVSILP